MQDHGVSTSFAAKIYRQYGNESLDKMKENPFQMADDIWGIGFKTADGIAQKLGFAKELTSGCAVVLCIHSVIWQMRDMCLHIRSS